MVQFTRPNPCIDLLKELGFHFDEIDNDKIATVKDFGVSCMNNFTFYNDVLYSEYLKESIGYSVHPDKVAKEAIKILKGKQ